MNDCCASSSQGKHSAPTSKTLPTFAVRPGVTFPDWSLVTSPAVKDALQTMVGSDHVFDRWSGYDPITDRVRVALLQLYAEDGRAPTLATSRRKNRQPTA
jgi:mercuric reductase